MVLTSDVALKWDSCTEGSAGVPATHVAEWAGHSVEVLLTIYAKCIEGRDRVWLERIYTALGGGPV
jgi:hypothetical protein